MKDTLLGQSTSSALPGVPRPQVPDANQGAITRLRDRVRELEQQLKSVQGFCDVWKSKAGRATAREEFILAEVKNASDDMIGRCCFFVVVYVPISSPLNPPPCFGQESGLTSRRKKNG